MQVMKEEMPLVSNVMVIGDNKKFLSMLVSLKVEVDPDTAVPTNILTKPAVAILEGCVRRWFAARFSTPPMRKSYDRRIGREFVPTPCSPRHLSPMLA